LRSFQAFHDDAIFGYIKVLTANLVHDYFRASRRDKRGGSATTGSIDGGFPGKCVAEPAEPSADVERKILMEQIEACLDAATAGPNAARDRRIFRLYYRVGLTASAIAGLPNMGVTTKGVESIILRLTRLVRHRLVTSRLESASGPGKGIRAAESL
jgi:RNA polymerase sigma-70 factor (ECF subfamily)